MAKVYLLDAVSQETAYEQPDYPYGRELRCQRRVWVETREKHGQRFVHQTNNPRKAHKPWNKPHAETYDACVLLILDTETDLVETAIMQAHYPEKVEPFVREHSVAFRKAGYRRDLALRLLTAVPYKAILENAKESLKGLPAEERLAKVNELRAQARKKAEAILAEIAPLET